MNFQMIAKDLLLIVDFKDFYVINISKYNLVKKINIIYSASSNIFSSYILNKNIILTGDDRGKIMQWKIKDDDMKLMSNEKDFHNDSITVLLKLGDGHILVGAINGFIKIWLILLFNKFIYIY